MLFDTPRLESSRQLRFTKISTMSEVELRTHRPGDIGYIIHRHGVLYSEEQGWDERFEAYVAEIMVDFVQNFDSKAERCWIAERDGQFLGCVMICKDKESPKTARLRVFLVEPSARGSGLGNKMVQACVDFCRDVGYKDVLLSTQSTLGPARHLYAKAGFKVIREENYTVDILPEGSKGEVWQLTL